MKEKERLHNPEWKRWGPYLANRQWATVREDYSDDGNTWHYLSFEESHSRAYRWGEDGIGGICDSEQLICFSLALWNKKDPIIKEKLFGLTNREGNHGEDVKELYYYLDSTPTHSYMKMLYKYPQQEFPYQQLREINRNRNRLEPEFEIQDTGIFNENKYFDVYLEYAKATPNDILIKITVCNRAEEDASLSILPTIWFRNTWSWGVDGYKPILKAKGNNVVIISHRNFPSMALYSKIPSGAIFCENQTNTQKLFNRKSRGVFKDGINDFIVHGKEKAVSKKRAGTKAAFHYDVTIPARSSFTTELRLCPETTDDPFNDFESIFNERKGEADEYYKDKLQGMDVDHELICRQAFAGMMWNKMFYNYDLDVWLNGDFSNSVSPLRKKGRNSQWTHLHNYDIISMPDKWEYPWYAAWDLAFHCIPLAMLDVEFAKSQLTLLTLQRYMHPNGQLPAYEWNFSDVNPPVHAWATWEVYRMGKNEKGEGDIQFLERIFHKLLLNFTWWVNRKDTAGNNIFQGGFLGLDNIGVFDRNARLPDGSYIEQADGTSWMAMYALNMLRIALELTRKNIVYEEMCYKFFEHFLYISGAMAHMGENHTGLWDPEDKFYYDQIRLNDEETIRLKVRSMVGLIPLFAVEIFEDEILNELPRLREYVNNFLRSRPDLSSLVSKWEENSDRTHHMLSLLRKDELVAILERMLDESEFLSPYGIRSVSKFHEKHPFSIDLNGQHFSISYTPGESNNDMFGGNSNWRGPVWFPLNYMIITSLEKFYGYYGDDLKVEFPSGTGHHLNLKQVAEELSKRLTALFSLNEHNQRPVYGNSGLFQNDPLFRDNLMFFEYFHGDTGRGLGATQQTGWTGLVAPLIIHNVAVFNPAPMA